MADPIDDDENIALAKPDDDARARRWVEHMMGGAWNGDWEDRYAAARVLMHLRSRISELEAEERRSTARIKQLEARLGRIVAVAAGRDA